VSAAAGAGRVTIVTGASSGVGLAVVKRLAARGERVVLVARRKDKLDALAREIGEERAMVCALDVTDLRAIEGLPRRVIDHFGRLDVLVNNAGLNHRGPVAERTAAELADIITVNLVAPIALTRAALAVMDRGAAIVNVASIAGMIPVPEEATYSASKAGLRAFTRALAEEQRSRGVRIASVCPGPIDTDFIADVDHVPDLVFSQPMATPDEVAAEVIACIDGGAEEVALPRTTGKLATLGYVFPALARAIRPALARRGAVNKRRYLERKGRGAGS